MFLVLSSPKRYSLPVKTVKHVVYSSTAGGDMQLPVYKDYVSSWICEYMTGTGERHLIRGLCASSTCSFKQDMYRRVQRYKHGRRNKETDSFNLTNKTIADKMDQLLTSFLQTPQQSRQFGFCSHLEIHQSKLQNWCLPCPMSHFSPLLLSPNVHLSTSGL